MNMQLKGLPLDFGNLPLGSLYEDRLVEDLLLLVDVVSACQDGDDAKLAELGVAAGTDGRASATDQNARGLDGAAGDGRRLVTPA
jgi:hypothetical protein